MIKIPNSNKKQYTFRVVILLCIITTLFSCSYNHSFNAEGWTAQDKAMGTSVQITIFSPPSDSSSNKSKQTPEDILDELMEDIQNYGTLFGKYSPEGDIYKINNTPSGQAVKVSPLTLDLMEKALTYAEATEGLFDPSINPLVSLWSRYKKEEKIPPQNEIKKAMQLISYNKVALNKQASTITLTKQGMGLDLGGVAKGYIADLLFEKLENYGISSAIINLGGNIHIKGTKQWGKQFLVGIQDPNKDIGEYVGVLSAKNQAVVTSGDYQRFVILEGKKYHHIIDPRTGSAGVSDLRSATIVCNKGSEADALATGVFLMGLKRGREFIEKAPQLEAIFITEQNKVILSSGLKKNFQLTNSDYELMP